MAQIVPVSDLRDYKKVLDRVEEVICTQFPGHIDL